MKYKTNKRWTREAYWDDDGNKLMYKLVSDMVPKHY